LPALLVVAALARSERVQRPAGRHPRL